MSRHWKLTLTAIAMGMGLAGCVPDDGYYGGGYAAGGYGYNNYGYGYGYCDDYGCPAGDYDLAYGGAYYGGIWYDQPLYYRDFAGGRQYWIHGGWHRDEWNGAHPADHRGHDATWWRDHPPAQANGGNDTGGNRGPRRGNDRDFGGRNGNAVPNSNAAQPVQNQAQDRGNRGGDGNRGFNRGDRGDGGNRNFSRGDGNGGGRASGGGDGGDRSFSRGDGNGGGGRSFSGGGGGGGRASGGGGSGGSSGGGGGTRSSGGGGGSSSGGSNSGGNGGNGRSR